MRLTRRSVLLGGLSAAALPATLSMVPRPVFAEAAPVLRAAPGLARIGPEDAAKTAIWGYDGAVPGPAIRLKQGERVRRRFVNDLPQASTVHWHGIRIENAMDGVPGLTQPVVAPGADFLYDFVVPDAGSYWYHPHNRSWEQQARGLYGPLIVEEAVPQEVDRDEMLLIDDWRLTEAWQVDESFGALHDWAHGGRLGNWATVNGDGDLSVPARRHERFRLRLVNTSNARILTLALIGLDGWTVAVDGQPLEAPVPLAAESDRIVLGPAQRVDVIVDVTGAEGEEAFVAGTNGDQRFALATFPISGVARTVRSAAPGALPPNPLPPVDPRAVARSVTLTMEGGAMGGLRRATMNGRTYDLRELAQRGKVWAFNGAVDMPEAPLVDARLGETVEITMVNRTAWPHAMHLHGHHFKRVGPDGGLGPWRDTDLVAARETARILFHADNPGDWLLHCHMLEHAEAGMRTWLRVG
ncbi:MAG: multicopper oxidase family protein [Alphaproteobacteria bacterium]|nr:multicopper oxidase family protein [Alphaproteobacteria bacterium]